jgi:hypothetical protein
MDGTAPKFSMALRNTIWANALKLTLAKMSPNIGMSINFYRWFRGTLTHMLLLQINVYVIRDEI